MDVATEQTEHPAPQAWDWRRLPYGLKRYDKDGDTFGRFHDAGSMTVTASGIPSVFGLKDAWSSAFAYALHISGQVPIDFKGTALTERGTFCEEVVLRMFEADTGRTMRQVKAWARHPQVPDLIASPDAIEIDATGQPVGLGEVKVVADLIFREKYQGGDKNARPYPPLPVILQHQTVLACTEQATGPVMAWELGGFKTKVWPWDIERHQPTCDRIAQTVHDFMKDLRAGKLPDPDYSLEKDQEAIKKLYRVIEPGDVIDLRERPDLSAALGAYADGKDREKRGKALAKAAQAEIIHGMGSNPLALIGDKLVKSPMVTRAGYFVNDTTFRDFRVCKVPKELE